MNTDILKAVADPTRFELLLLILRRETCACDLPVLVKVSQPAVSQHLQVLRNAGLVNFRKSGAKRLYSISKKGIMVLKDISRW